MAFSLCSKWQYFLICNLRIKYLKSLILTDQNSVLRKKNQPWFFICQNVFAIHSLFTVLSCKAEWGLILVMLIEEITSLSCKVNSCWIFWVPKIDHAACKGSWANFQLFWSIFVTELIYHTFTSWNRKRADIEKQVQGFLPSQYLFDFQGVNPSPFPCVYILTIIFFHTLHSVDPCCPENLLLSFTIVRSIQVVPP